MKRFSYLTLTILAAALVVSYALAHQSMQGDDQIGYGPMHGGSGNSWFHRMIGGAMGMMGNDMMGGGHMMGGRMGNNTMGGGHMMGGRMGNNTMGGGRMMGGRMGNNTMGGGRMMGNNTVGGGRMMGGRMGNNTVGGSDTNNGWGATTTTELETPLTRETALQQVEQYLDTVGNENLRTGDIREKDADFEVDMVTRNGSLVDQLVVNKRTGWIHSAYLWNGTPRNEGEVRQAVQRTITMSGNPNLKPGTVQKTEDGFDVEILTTDGDIVGTVHLNPDEGWNCYRGQTI